MTRGGHNRTTPDTFWARVDKQPGQGPDGTCWLWLGCRSPLGYGRLCVDGRLHLAHRYAYELTHGELPKFSGDMKTTVIVRHTCDVPACCNPDHLLPGTQKDNAADREARKRGGSWKLRGRPRVGPVRKGVEVNTARLTENDVRDLRERFPPGTKRPKGLAKQYGVSADTIRRIIDMKTWKHLS